MKTVYNFLLISLITATSCFAQTGFVKVNGTHFTIDGKPYKYIGANYWYGGLLATNGVVGKKRLIKELTFLKKMGVTNLRIMVGAEGTSDYAYRTPNDKSLQPEAGKYDEHIIKGLDYLLDELGKRNMKAVLHFTNTWEWSGGLGQYLKWNGFGESPLPKNPGYSWDNFQKFISQFYTCKNCMDEADNYIKYVLNRTNSVNGKKYTDDPAIMAWEIINEPRPMDQSTIGAFEQWMQHVSSLVKSIDKNHLLTTGSEGDIASFNDLSIYENIHADKNIDYATIHIWPKNWGWFKDTSISASYDKIVANAETYAERHLELTKKLNKPLVIEEFGLPRDQQAFNLSATTNSRDKFYDFIFKMVMTNTDIAGCNFWAFGGTARPISGQTFWKNGDEFMGDPGGEEQGLNSVFDLDTSTWRVIKKYTAQAATAQ